MSLIKDRPRKTITKCVNNFSLRSNPSFLTTTTRLTTRYRRTAESACVYLSTRSDNRVVSCGMSRVTNTRSFNDSGDTIRNVLQRSTSKFDTLRGGHRRISNDNFDKLIRSIESSTSFVDVTTKDIPKPLVPSYFFLFPLRRSFYQNTPPLAK